jgi:hypothetical protein
VACAAFQFFDRAASKTSAAPLSSVTSSTGVGSESASVGTARVSHG